ncbi:hypothetical protein Sez_0637 [Streptococcus equi subsp. zooepidemicus MGCS10565]|uniref:Uncharacterized protein n=1 Tax=Streptococcus equi subsp. zooepidemicus (strain MGCS10565) TaxID=552526 RepID=B4U1Y7_STREM|nr:hypothetical protein Sez_0637 [Streptococcus equi subsp. zooepidemicus MGCS10565]
MSRHLANQKNNHSISSIPALLKHQKLRQKTDTSQPLQHQALRPNSIKDYPSKKVRVNLALSS